MIRTGILLLAALVVGSPSIAQTSTPSNAAAPTLNIPTSQGIIAKLDTDLDASRNKPGDLVQAETTRELKVGHERAAEERVGPDRHVTSADVQQRFPFNDRHRFRSGRAQRRISCNAQRENSSAGPSAYRFYRIRYRTAEAWPRRTSTPHRGENRT